MKKQLSLSLVIISLLFLSHATEAQTWQWVNGMGSTYQPPTNVNGTNKYGYNESIEGIGLDNTGNVYVGGSTYRYPHFGTVNITTPPLGTKQGYMGFVAKYGCDGSQKWVKTMLSNSGFDNVSGFVVDNQGNSYVTGRSDYDTAFFGGIAYTTSGGGHGWFLAKYDSNGTFKWVTFARAGFPINKLGETIGINSAGVIVVAGSASIHAGTDSTIFTGISIHSSPGNMEGFVAGFDPTTGNALWAKNIDKIAPGTIYGSFPLYTSMVIDNNNNIYFAGWFSDTAQIGTQLLYAPHLYNHSFIAKFDPTGNFIWARQGHCASNFDGFQEMTYSKFDNSLIVKAQAFKTDTIFNYPIHVTGGTPIETYIILKFDTAANLMWGINQDSLSGLSTTLGQFTTDNAGNVYYTTGWGSGSKLKWGSYPSLTYSAYNYSYILKLNSSGVVQSLIVPNVNTIPFPPGTPDDEGEAIVVSPQGDIFLAGAFSGKMYAGADSIVNSGGDNDMYLIKYGDNLCPTTATPQLKNEQDNVTVYPNPNNGNFTLSWHLSSPNAELRITDITGRAVYSGTIFGADGKQEINVANLSSGMYFYEIVSGNNGGIKGKISVVK